MDRDRPVEANQVSRSGVEKMPGLPAGDEPQAFGIRGGGKRSIPDPDGQNGCTRIERRGDERHPPHSEAPRR
jgi:hypothetical protein